jgi:protein gp37
MADGTKIEWTDATWNPITGCAVVSPGCTNCYAMKLAGTRLKNHRSRKGLTKDTKAGPVWTGEIRFNRNWLDQPLRWTKPRMIFVCAHGDLFAEGVDEVWIDHVFAVMALAPQHTFQVLTKRPERMREYVLGMLSRRQFIAGYGALIWGGDRPDLVYETVDDAIAKPLPNVWLGVSVEDQKRADERIPILLDTPAAVRWISAEPLLGPVTFRWASWQPWHKAGKTDHLDGLRRLDWIVAGGESGPGARPMHPDWVRALRDQCAAAGVPFLFKQWGNWREACSDWRDDEGNHIEVAPDTDEGEALFDDATDRLISADGRLFTPDTLPPDTPARLIERVTKKAAGRLLDGIEHNGFPEVRR